MNANVKRGLVLLAVAVPLMFIALALQRGEPSSGGTSPAAQFVSILVAGAFWAGLLLIGWGLVHRH